MKNSRCYLCRNDNYRILITKSKYSIVKCNICSFVYTTPIPNGNVVKKIYAKFDYKDSISAETTIRTDAQKSLKKIGKYVNKNKVILDVGCGRGYFLDEARKMGWDTYGIDVSEAVVRFARDRLQLNVIQSDIFSYKTNIKFDVISLNQVIEHFIDPRKLIAICYKYLKDDGMLYIATPNVESVSALVMKDRFDHYIPPEHLSYFSKSTLKSLLLTSGYKVIYAGSWSYPQDLAGIIKSLLGKKDQYSNFDKIRDQVDRSSVQSNLNIKQIKSILFDKIFCRLFYKVLTLDSFGICLDVLAKKI